MHVIDDGEDDDQVPRLIAFRKAHPDWRIGLDHSLGLWRAVHLFDGGSEIHCRYELRDLLDRLERQS